MLTYHIYPASLRGGFVGVDIFFVCSGYLTSALMISEYSKSNGIKLGAFYLRRFRRLFPALAGAVLFGMALSLLISPDFRVGMGRQALAALGGFTNYYEISTGSSYENQFLSHLFVHTWALSVEIQFYAVWGALVAGAAWLHRKKPAPGRLAKTVLAAAVVLGAASYAVMRLYFRDFAEGGDPARAYYAFESRAFSLLAGAAAGAIAGVSLPYRLKKLAAKRGFKPAAWTLTALCVAGLAALAAVLRYNEYETYYFGLLLAAGLAAFAAGLARTADFPNLTGAPLAVLNYLSSRSYGIFLYHWPLRVVVSQLVVSGAVAPVTVLLSFLAAEGSYRLVERRFRVFSVGNFSFRNFSFKNFSLRNFAFRNSKRLIMFRLIVSIIAMVLLTASAYSIVSAPPKTSIQLDLEAEADLAASMLKARDAQVRTETGVEDAEDASMEVIPGEAGAEAIPKDPGREAIPEDNGLDAIPESNGREEILEDNTQETAPPPAATAPEASPAPIGPASSPPPEDSGTPADVPGDAGEIETPSPKSVLVIGDSVTLGALSAILETIPGVVVDAKESRDVRTGLSLLAEYAEKGELGDVIVIALAENNINRKTEQRVVEVIETYGDGRLLVFVTGYGKDNTNPVTEFIRTLPDSYPHVAVADWAEAIALHPEWLYTDRTHIKTRDAKRLYAELIVKAIERLETTKTEAETAEDSGEPVITEDAQEAMHTAKEMAS